VEQGSSGAGEQGTPGAGDSGSRGDGENIESNSLDRLCPSALLPLCSSAPLPTCSLAHLPAFWVDAIALTVGLIVITFGLGDYGFYEPHEGHFAGVAREMLLRGDWVTPTLNGAPYLNKPPLLYWLIATSTATFGFTEYAARLPVAIAGWLGAIIAWKWARELWNVSAGRAAALMLCVTTGWFIFTHQILIDVLLSTLLLASYYCLWRLVAKHSWRYSIALYLLLGLCVLAKGPFVLVFAIALCAAVAVSRRCWKIFHQLRLPLGTCIVLAVALPWFIAVETANPGFWHYFLFNENLNRIADRRWPPDYDVSKVSAWGYLAVTAIWCAPWSLLLPQTIISTWRNWQQEQNQHRREGVLLLFVAAALPILLFLPLSSRLVYYSLPSVAPVVILSAGWWSSCHERGGQYLRRVTGMIFGLVGLGIASAAFWASPLVMSLPEVSHLPAIAAIIPPSALVTGIGFLFGGLCLLANRPTLSLIGLFLATAFANAAMTYGFVAVANLRSAKTLIETANPRLGITTLWTFEGSRELGVAGAMSYYLDRDGTQEEDAGTGGQGDAGTFGQKLSAFPYLRVPASSSIPAGWVEGKPGIAYRVVMVLTDGGGNRIPPAFPGSRPEYAIAKNQLQKYWHSPRPVVFITDFMRQPNDPFDPPNLNLPDDAGEPLLVIGARKLYGNLAARKLWLRRGY
jgi:4-amino-4-deoxy-L-arabinose transferase-like glycosyltransferase